MNQDEAIDEIRSVREQIARECDNDPHLLVQHYIRQQKQNAHRLRTGLKRSSLRRELE